MIYLIEAGTVRVNLLEVVVDKRSGWWLKELKEKLQGQHHLARLLWKTVRGAVGSRHAGGCTRPGVERLLRGVVGIVVHIEVGVVQRVVELRAKLEFQALPSQAGQVEIPHHRQILKTSSRAAVVVAADGAAVRAIHGQLTGQGCG